MAERRRGKENPKRPGYDIQYTGVTPDLLKKSNLPDSSLYSYSFKFNYPGLPLPLYFSIRRMGSWEIETTEHPALSVNIPLEAFETLGYPEEAESSMQQILDRLANLLKDSGNIKIGPTTRRSYEHTIAGSIEILPQAGSKFPHSTTPFARQHEIADFVTAKLPQAGFTNPYDFATQYFSLRRDEVDSCNFPREVRRGKPAERMVSKLLKPSFLLSIHLVVVSIST